MFSTPDSWIVSSLYKKSNLVDAVTGIFVAEVTSSKITRLPSELGVANTD